ncbi:MAG: hypothetical protein OEY89_09620 [Gammaproteobacteria bacterium]|nr:hypothetical protein [Gammaproteobacteria bacterium]
MNKLIYRIPLQIFNYAVFMALVWYLSIKPPYHQLDEDQAMITFTLGHVGKHVDECIKVSQEELLKLPPNMRKPMSCSRERSPITMEMRLDDHVLYSKVVQPHGLYKDQGIDVYESIKVPAGKHILNVWINDDVNVDGPMYKHTQPIELKPEQHMIIQFISDSSSFKIK